MQLTEQNAQQVLIEDSHSKTVFCYFYQDGPECANATQALCAAIKDDNQYISLVMANVADRISQMIAMQLQLQGVPSLFIFKDGKPVALLQGDDIVNNLQKTLDEYMPNEAELTMRDALAAESSGDNQKAQELASKAYHLDDKNISYKHIYVRLLIKNKNLDRAKELLESAGREEKESTSYQELNSALDLALKAATSPEIMQLKENYERNHEDEKAAIDYAVALKNAGKVALALEILFNLLKEDLSRSEVKKVFLDILNTLSGDPLQAKYRRKLYTLMY